jgi:hypothetical protein
MYEPSTVFNSADCDGDQPVGKQKRSKNIVARIADGEAARDTVPLVCRSRPSIPDSLWVMKRSKTFSGSGSAHSHIAFVVRRLRDARIQRQRARHRGYAGVVHDASVGDAGAGFVPDVNGCLLLLGRSQMSV